MLVAGIRNYGSPPNILPIRQCRIATALSSVSPDGLRCGFPCLMRAIFGSESSQRVELKRLFDVKLDGFGSTVDFELDVL